MDNMMKTACWTVNVAVLDISQICLTFNGMASVVITD